MGDSFDTLADGPGLADFLPDVSQGFTAHAETMTYASDKNNLLEKKFNIPTRANSTKYKLNIGFPEELKKDETQEFIIVLATKRKFAILNQIKLSELLTRLDDEGKSNWYMQKIGYSVLRKK